MRENNEFDSLPEILEALTSGKFPELTFVGKNYSKADLIRDLRKMVNVGTAGHIDHSKPSMSMCVDVKHYQHELILWQIERIASLEAQLKSREWISVEDRLPLKTEDVDNYETVDVLVLSKNNNVSCVDFEMGNTVNTWHNFDIGLNDVVTHWQPLPEAT